MVIGLIGENCSGKSTLAEALAARIGAEIVSGKDYLRLAKSPSAAEIAFRKKLNDAVTGDNVIYVVSDEAQAGLLPDGAVRVYVRADLDTIKARFKARMRGVLPPPVEQMLIRNHGRFEGGRYDYVYDGAEGDPSVFCDSLPFIDK